MLSLPFSDFC